MPRGAPFASRPPLLLLRMLERTSHRAHQRCSRARSERGCVRPCAQDASSTWPRCGRSAARRAAGSGGRSEPPQSSRTDLTAVSDRARAQVSSLAAGVRVLPAAGPRRHLIGDRAREAARARVQHVQQDGGIVLFLHSVMFVRCRKMHGWRMPTKRMRCAHVMCM